MEEYAGRHRAARRPGSAAAVPAALRGIAPIAASAVRPAALLAGGLAVATLVAGSSVVPVAQAGSAPADAAIAALGARPAPARPVQVADEVAATLAQRHTDLAGTGRAIARDAQRQALAVGVSQTVAAAAKAQGVVLATAAEAAKAKAIADARSNPQAAAAALLADFGWSQSQMSCLIPLWNGESRWRYTAENRSSGAYGIPQALPGSKMSSAGADWRTNPVTQIRWGLGYIKSVYGSPCNALSRWNSRYPHWY